jgi:hypothetical protein
MHQAEYDISVPLDVSEIQAAFNEVFDQAIVFHAFADS